jgi:hypothetical protein
VPARCAKFVPRKQWVVIGSDDMFLRVFNYNTMDRVKMWEAHADYIRSIAIHPSLPYILSCSDDMLIKLWDWDKGFQCTQIFEGHVHYVMQVRAPASSACPACIATACCMHRLSMHQCPQQQRCGSKRSQARHRHPHPGRASSRQVPRLRSTSGCRDCTAQLAVETAQHSWLSRLRSTAGCRECAAQLAGTAPGQAAAARCEPSPALTGEHACTTCMPSMHAKTCR